MCVCVSGDPDNMYIAVCAICNCFRCKILDETILRFGNGILYHWPCWGKCYQLSLSLTTLSNLSPSSFSFLSLPLLYLIIFSLSLCLYLFLSFCLSLSPSPSPPSSPSPLSPLSSPSPLSPRGWEQLEVTCNPYRDDSNNLWNVEGNFNPKCKYWIMQLFINIIT